jgi:hypothetical protein
MDMDALLQRLPFIIAEPTVKSGARLVLEQ